MLHLQIATFVRKNFSLEIRRAIKNLLNETKSPVYRGSEKPKSNKIKIKYEINKTKKSKQNQHYPNFLLGTSEPQISHSSHTRRLITYYNHRVKQGVKHQASIGLILAW